MGSRVAGSSTSRSRREEKTRSTRPLTWRATVVKTKTHWIYRQNHWVLEFGHQRRRVRSKVARCDRRPPKKWTETAKRRDEESGPTKEGAKSYRSSSDGRTSWSARRDGPSGYLHVAALRQLRAQAGMEEGHGPGPAGACPKRFHMGAGTGYPTCSTLSHWRVPGSCELSRASLSVCSEALQVLPDISRYGVRENWGYPSCVRCRMDGRTDGRRARAPSLRLAATVPHPSRRSTRGVRRAGGTAVRTWQPPVEEEPATDGAGPLQSSEGGWMDGWMVNDRGT